MAIDLDTTRPLRRPLELRQLVQAVVAAGSADEAFWLECKNNEFDLTQAPGRFKTARAILSFANRMPDLAGTVCGGLAYVVIGAEPGKVDGTTVHDGADLDNWLVKYLGGDGPAWVPTYVKHGDKDVLVIVIEAPKWGDRTHTLRQDYERAVAGTPYYRSGSASRQARPDEIRLLENRLLRGQQAPQLDGLHVGFEIGMPDVLPVINPTDEQIDEWIDKRRTAIANWHASVITSDDMPGRFGLTGFDTRPRIDTAQIEKHLDVCRVRLFDATRHALISAEAALVSMVVTSPGPQVLDDVEMTLRIKTAYSAFEIGDPPEALKALPNPPAPPKPRHPLLANVPSLTALQHFSFDRPVLPPLNLGLDIEASGITLTIGRLRPEKPVSSPRFHLFLHERPTNDQLEVDWTLNSTSTHGLQKGSVLLPVHPNQRVFLPADDGIPEDGGRA